MPKDYEPWYWGINDFSAQSLASLQEKLERLVAQLKFNGTKLGIETADTLQAILNNDIPKLKKTIEADMDIAWKDGNTEGYNEAEMQHSND